jgi:hypothetical protein
MRNNALFWGGILILFGTLLLLDNLGILPVNFWGLFGPLLLILLGAWTLWGVFAPRRAPETKQVAIPLEGAARARIRVRHGAGQLTVNAGAGQNELLNGTFGGGLDYRAVRDGDELNVKMRVPRPDDFFFMPWMGWGPRRMIEWSFSLNRDIPLALDFRTGANDMRLDLTGLRVTDLRIGTGASSTEVNLPAQAGHTRVVMEAGAASIKVRVPQGVAARIAASGGAASIDVDQGRFPRIGVAYQSPDYETAPNRVEMEIRVGAGSVDIR